MQEYVCISKPCDVSAGQIRHIRRTHEIAAQSSVKSLNRGISPVFRPFPRSVLHFQRHFDPAYEFMT